MLLFVAIAFGYIAFCSWLGELLNRAAAEQTPRPE